MVKNIFLSIFSDPQIAFSLCIVEYNPEIKLLYLCPFLITIMGKWVSMVIK